MRKSDLVDGKGGEKILVQRLGVLESDSNPLIVYSDRKYSEVVGMAMREMPSPGMLRLFSDAISRRNPESKRTIQYLKGAPGAGKTYMSELIARMRSEKGAIKIDCGKKNLAELLYETVLDFGSDRNFYGEIDRRLQNNRLNPFSLKILRENLGEAFHEENGKISVDWEHVGQNLRDDKGELLESRKAVSIAIDALQRVSRLEGLEGGGNALGMATQEGPLIRAWKEGREIVLDEFNRGKEGTTASLHTVLQFLAGEIDEVKVENNLKEKGDDARHSFTFRRSDQRVGFFVTLTGNAEEDGSDVEELPQSVNSRIIPQFIPTATIEDWQHRICQILTGLPISTLYRAGEKQWSENPTAFRKKLLEWRKTGLSEQEVRNIPEIQLRLLRRWEDTLEASEKLARFYYGWSQRTNPDSQLYRGGDLAKLIEELDDRYNKEVSIDFRKIIDHIKEAMELRPSVKLVEESEGFDVDDWALPPVLLEEEKEHPAVNFGTRLTEVIMNNVSKTTDEIGKKGLYRELKNHAADCGLYTLELQEGKGSAARSVSDLLNDNPYDSRDIDVQAEVVRDLFASYVRSRHPGINAGNEQILTVGAMRSVLEDIAEEEEGENERGFYLFDDNDGAPLVKAPVLDSATQAGEKKTLPPSALVSRLDVLFAMAAPAVREQNVEKLWAKGLSKTGAVVQDSQGNVAKDESLAMAEGASETGLAVTTLVVANDTAKNDATSLHIVWNKKTRGLLVVGEGAPTPDLKKAFNCASIAYVNKLDADATKKTQAALGRILGGGTERKKNEGLLKTAFLMRVMLDSPQDEEKLSLSELLTKRESKTYLPLYVRNATIG